MQKEIMWYCLILLLLTGSLCGMDNYQLELHLSADQKKEIERGLDIVKGWKKCPQATISGWRAEAWMSEILKGQTSSESMSNGETILTYLVKCDGFGELDYSAIQCIIRMYNHGANLNQENDAQKTPLTIAIARGRHNLIDTLVWRGANLNTLAADNTPNNPIRAGLQALETARQDILLTVYSNIWLRKECEMLMAYLLDRVPPQAITKSQVKAAWKLGSKDVSRAMAFCRKYPENRNAIVIELKKEIAASLVREFLRIDKRCRKKNNT